MVTLLSKRLHAQNSSQARLIGLWCNMLATKSEPRGKAASQHWVEQRSADEL